MCTYKCRKKANRISKDSNYPNCSACCHPADGTAASGPTPPGLGQLHPSGHKTAELLSSQAHYCCHFTPSCYYLLVTTCLHPSYLFTSHLYIFILFTTVYTCKHHSMRIYSDSLTITVYIFISAVTVQYPVHNLSISQLIHLTHFINSAHLPPP